MRRRRRLDPEDRDAALFLVGMAGLISSQVIYYLNGTPPNETLTWVWAGFSGGAVLLRILDGARGVLNGPPYEEKSADRDHSSSSGRKERDETRG